MEERFMTPVELPRTAFKMEHRQSVMAMGSCFAAHIGTRLAEGGFRTENNPYGVLYNPLSIAGALRQIIEGRRYSPDAPELVCHGGKWHSLMHHSTFSAPQKEECLALINRKREEATEALKQAEVLLITFGSAWVYRYRPTGQVVANCHKIPDALFIRQKLEPEEIVSEYTALCDELVRFCPDIHLIFTISPIRHKRDGMHGNQLSKATLMLAVEKLIQSHPERCHYFPAYEIMMDELRDYRFYADDMLHPGPLAISYIWSRFKECFFTPQTRELTQEWEKVSKALAHRPSDPDAEAYKLHCAQLEKQIEELKQRTPHPQKAL